MDIRSTPSFGGTTINVARNQVLRNTYWLLALSLIPTVLGATATLRISNTFVITDEAGRTASIAATDVLASNGVIHVIDRVILPSAFASA